jgi:type II secretory pathway pseudopilin PulG
VKISRQLSRPRHRALGRLGCGSREDGYVLLTLLLVVSLFVIAFTYSIYYDQKFALAQRRRDQEQELIHRGVQYSRAIRAYYKKFGRYPTRLEDLDNTNNLRYLRKHYKDPITGKDFRLLHYGDPGVTLGGSIGGGVIPGANTVGQMNGSTSGSSSSAFGGSGFGNSGFGNSQSGFGSSGTGSSGGFSQSSSFGGNSNSAFGGSSSSQTSSSQPGTSTTAGTDASQPVTQTPGTASSDATSSGQQVISGGPIVGVASTSKETTIREFNHKRKYNEWQFVYDPSSDLGGLIRTPNQPPLQLAGQPMQNGQNGQTGSSNTNGSSFGQGTGFGSNNSSSFGGNNSSSFGGSSAPSQPPANSPQPQ